MKNRKIKNKALSATLLSIGMAALFTSCASMPKNAQPIEDFEIQKYLGSWYEIARFDFRFEKDLNNVMAQYSLNDKQNVVVVNSGYNVKKEKWVSAKGVAKFRGSKNSATLKVSFFGPFYSGYNVIALDKEYRYALVAGKNLKYLWILAREKSIPEAIKTHYLQIAQEVGYDTSGLIWVEHNKTSPFEDEK